LFVEDDFVLVKAANLIDAISKPIRQYLEAEKWIICESLKK